MCSNESASINSCFKVVARIFGNHFLLAIYKEEGAAFKELK